MSDMARHVSDFLVTFATRSYEETAPVEFCLYLYFIFVRIFNSSLFYF